jgi:hypothetical protein
MKNTLLRVLSLIFIIGTGHAVNAQYPVIPTAVQEASDRELKKSKQRSDEAWQKALPIVEREAKNGRPYVPWASKPSDLIKANIPAFPGAEGGGAYTPGGRGGKIHVVTNLNDDGPGSFRWACEQGGARIVVFNVAGIIRLNSPVIIRAPYITIAGQTAPGDGVCIAGESVWIDTHDVIIRHMRFRRGETNVARRDDALGGNPVGNIMIDHVSASWGLDENMSIYRHLYDKGDGSKPLKLATANVTIQNSIFSEGLDTYNHSFGSTIGGGGNTTFMRNLWACNVGRNPSIGMGEAFNFVNNVVFNWWNRTADGGGNNARFNFINNYYKPGPVTPSNRPISHRIIKMEGGGPGPVGKRRFGYTYAAGNIVHGNAGITDDNWAGGVQMEEMSLLREYVGQIRVNEPFPMAKMTILTADEAYEYVLKNAGATFPKRDAVDKRIVRQVRTGNIEYKEGVKAVVNTPYIKRRLPQDSYKNGIITDPAQVGGYPVYRGTPYKDADSDGMPDEWERKNNLNPNDASDASKDRDGDGYTNIEEYINHLVPG